MSGSSFLVGNLVELGSHGMVVAVLFMVKKSVICVNREFAVFFGSVIVTWYSGYTFVCRCSRSEQSSSEPKSNSQRQEIAYGSTPLVST
jgi:hypothetical protein